MVTSLLVSLVGWVPAVIILLVLLVFTFYLLAIVCDEALAPTLEELSDALNIPHDVACATFLAAGSSAPEIAISLMSVVHGGKNPLDISLGALLGSALIALTVIPACCVMVSPNRQLKLDLVPLARDVVFFSFGILWVIHAQSDAMIDLGESAVLVVMFFVYLLTMKLLTPYYAHKDDQHHFLTTEPSSGNINVNTISSAKYGSIEEGSNESRDSDEPSNGLCGTWLRSLIPPFNMDQNYIKNHYMWILLVSLFYVSVLSEFALYFAESLSDLIGVNHHLTGLVLVALGAQIPDTVSSMAVAKHGEGPSSIANAVGSQVLNINIGIGFPYLLSNIIRGQSVALTGSSNAGHLIFLSMLFFLFLVVVERMTLKVRDAAILLGLYFSVLIGFGISHV